MSKNPLQQLLDFGQSFWMDTISREIIRGGAMKRMIREDGLRGVTSNPDIFQKAISGSDLYDDQIKKLALAGKNVSEIYEALAVEDIKKAADVLKPVHTESKGVDGYISLEVSPYLAFDKEGTIEEAHRLWKAVDKDNVLIKVPATPEGIQAIRRLIADGISINVTLIFSLKAYKAVMEAYIAGLEERVKKGLPVKGISSVASFFISRVDVLVDKLLATRNIPAQELQGKAAIASAKIAYQDFKEMFSGKRWEVLEKAGARKQRPLWASTGNKNPLYNEIGYVSTLIGPDTVNTMPMATIDAWRALGQPQPNTIEEGVEEARDTLKKLKKIGIDLDAVTWQLVEEGVAKFNQPFDKLLASLSEKRKKILGIDADQSEHLGSYEKLVKGAAEFMTDARFATRLLSKDVTLFNHSKETQALAAQRLGWLDSPKAMLEEIPMIAKFVAGVKKDKIRTVVLIGMGGSSLAPEVAYNIFETTNGAPDFYILDTTSPEYIESFTNKITLSETLFIVSSKSGSTLETISLYEFYKERMKAAGVSNIGSHFAAITDAGSQLDKLGKAENFRHIFLNPSDIGGRYSALSFFGLVPMALVGIDIKKLLQRTLAYAADTKYLIPTLADPAVRLGAILGVLAQNGRDKLTLIASESITPIGAWIEQLIAESTGKEGKGILPIDQEKLVAAKKYGNDRVFVTVELAGDNFNARQLDALTEAGHPVIRLRLNDAYDLGVEFLRWEIATAIAGAVLGINPFDEPNVSESKAITESLLDELEREETLIPWDPVVSVGSINVYVSDVSDGKIGKRINQAVDGFAGSAEAGDYISVLAFLAPTEANRKTLEKIRTRLRSLTNAPVTIGFGPRYQHSCGQIHKGGANNGLFIIIIAEPKKHVEIPNQPYTFGSLIRAQGIGDFQTLQNHSRRAVLIDLGTDGKLSEI